MVGLVVTVAALIALVLGFVAGATWAMRKSRTATEAASTALASLVRRNAELEATNAELKRRLADCLSGGQVRRNGRNGRHP
jgi:cell division protein FtsB